MINRRVFLRSIAAFPFAGAAAISAKPVRRCFIDCAGIPLRGYSVLSIMIPCEMTDGEREMLRKEFQRIYVGTKVEVFSRIPDLRPISKIS